MVLTKQEPMTGRGWAGIAFAVGGIYLVITKGKGLDIGLANLFGNVLILLGALFWSYYLIKVKQWMAEKQHSVLQVTILSMTTGLSLLIPVGASQLYLQEWLTIPSLTWGLILYTVIGGGIISSLLWTWGVRGIGLNRTVIYQYLVPVVAVIGAWIVLGEPITMPKIFGGILVLSGIYLARRR
jgi:drug/metabolite transporter (DMT)-like permease